MGGYAWVTLATNDSYSLGALVLAHSLRQVSTPHQLVVLVTPGVTNVMRQKLAGVFNVVQEVNTLDSKDEENLRLLKRPELGITFTKLHCWRLVQFEKCVFLDADTLVLSNCDELFEREEFSAAPDVGWPDCFNSGVFVYRPSNQTYSKLIDFALEKGSFDGGDQGLLNLYFADWAHKDISKHLPFIYNMCSTATYSYLPAFKQYGKDAKIVHFIGPAKPWLQYFDTENCTVYPSSGLQHLGEVLQRWWNIFCSSIHPTLSPDMSGLAGAFAQFTLGAKRTASQDALENHLRRQAWEVGNIDYLGRDSFDNIWSKICESLSIASPEVTAAETQTPPSKPPPAAEISGEIPSDVTIQAVSRIPDQTQEITKPVEKIEESSKVEQTAQTDAGIKETTIETQPAESPLEETQKPQADIPIAAQSQVETQITGNTAIAPKEQPLSELPKTASTEVTTEAVEVQKPETESVEVEPEATSEIPEPIPLPESQPVEELKESTPVDVPKPQTSTEPVIIEQPQIEAVEQKPTVLIEEKTKTPTESVEEKEEISTEAPNAVVESKPDVAGPVQDIKETPTEAILGLSVTTEPVSVSSEIPKSEVASAPSETSVTEPPLPTDEAIPTQSPKTESSEVPKPDVMPATGEQPKPDEPLVPTQPALPDVCQPVEEKVDAPVVQPPKSEEAVESKHEVVPVEAPKSETQTIAAEPPKSSEASTTSKMEPVAEPSTPEPPQATEQHEGEKPKKKVIRKVKKVAPKVDTAATEETTGTSSEAAGEEGAPTPPPRKTTTGVKKVKTTKKP